MPQSAHMPGASPSASRHETRSRRIALSALAAFAAVVLLVNGFMILTAVRTFTGVAVKGAYERGLTYNRTLEAARAQDQLGWRGEVDFEQTDPSAGRLSLRLQDADGRPISGAEVEVVLFRPAQEGQDFRVNLNRTGAGVYQADLSFPAAGVWDAYLAAHAREASFQRRERLLVQ